MSYSIAKLGCGYQDDLHIREASSEKVCPTTRLRRPSSLETSRIAFLILIDLGLVLNSGRLLRPAAAFLDYCTCLCADCTHAELRLAKTGDRKPALPVDQGR